MPAQYRHSRVEMPSLTMRYCVMMISGQGNLNEKIEKRKQMEDYISAELMVNALVFVHALLHRFLLHHTTFIVKAEDCVIWNLFESFVWLSQQQPSRNLLYKHRMSRGSM